jgi:hypothetical protein
MNSSEFVAVVSAVLSLIYATILIWDRLSEKPKLKIEEIDLEMFENGMPHISVTVKNNGRREAVNCTGYLTLFDANKNKLKIKDFLGREVDERPMFWVRHPSGSFMISRTEFKTTGKIQNQKISLQTRGETKEAMNIEKHLCYTLGVGDWNVLRLTLPGVAYTPPFMHAGEYEAQITVSSALDEAEKKIKFRFPEDFHKSE